MCSESGMLHDFEITVLGVASSSSCQTLFDLSQGKRIVIGSPASLNPSIHRWKIPLDFWTTKCVKCPAALEKLNHMAVEFPDVLFVACVLNDKEMAEEIIEESGWENMTHIFVESAVKESLKAQYGFSEVPFCLVIDSVRILSSLLLVSSSSCHLSGEYHSSFWKSKEFRSLRDFEVRG